MMISYIYTHLNYSDSGSEDTSPVNGGSGQYDDDVCRDYMRNVCTRGKRCRYRHPNLDDRSDHSTRHDLTFCHDYQNNGCNRPNCKFLHCTRDEEEYFHRTGLLPSRLNHAIVTGGGHLKMDVPLCRDYLNGDCKRGSKCKYRHENEKGDYDRMHHHRRNDRHYDYAPQLKRRRGDDEYESIRSGISFSLLEDENIMLKRKIEELKKQVSDLTAINEVLLDQNARYRISKATASLHVPSNQNLPTMALGATVNPGHAQASINQMNSALTQQVALNSDLATQHAIAAQRMAAAVAQSRAPQSAMGVSPSVTLTQNVASALALTQSNMSVSMASMPQLHVAHSLTQNLGAPSTTLVSYPIMSHSMRSAVEPSSLTH
ncbi:zinc finger CCCH domain-containing protein 10-like isoform X2 [Biomphalaria glabrata]|uniref:Zinc finger CCCH domain-containing protein 10-like isoform X2 n=1 Tax=Biomphalaria glabrata TaxID=6526 RepID=A0A2C9K1Y5_BIOGL|nr:zinc finger CCCH domain-containing protein 10-like isoform X2 [Biomphalaria glabrata]